MEHVPHVLWEVGTLNIMVSFYLKGLDQSRCKQRAVDYIFPYIIIKLGSSKSSCGHETRKQMSLCRMKCRRGLVSSKLCTAEFNKETKQSPCTKAAANKKSAWQTDERW